MRPNKLWLASLVACLAIAQTLFWELGRVRPDFQLIVEPWTIRGYETVHGTVFTTIGLALLAFTFLVGMRWATNLRASIGLTVGMGATMVVIAAVAGGAEFRLGTTALTMVVAVFGGLIVARALADPVRRLLPDVSPFTRRFVTWLVVTIVLWVAVGLSIQTEGVTLAPWAWVLIIAAFTGAYSIATRPYELAANRMLLWSTIVGWAAITLSSGAIRTTLLRLQVEEIGISAQYKDVQVTSGWFIAEIAFAVIFLGAMAMWAKRRDLIIAQQRAARQREAAIKSAQEIQAALEKAQSAAG